MSAPEPLRVLFLCSGNYYRSRFAEELFNHLAASAGLAYRADSAGLWPNCQSHNAGAMSTHTISGLRERGVPLPAVLRLPRDVTEHDLHGAQLAIALKESEHRPVVESRFPGWLERVEFWHVDDVGDSPPSVALPQIERAVRELVERLSKQTG
jgi:protein-tyrosine phosphatase